ncbi:MAG: GIN domain-containing protein, partial [Flavobacterium sp.]
MRVSFLYIVVLLLLLSSCSLTEECFKKTGVFVEKRFQTEAFDKVYVSRGISLVLQQTPNHEVVVVTGKNLIDNIKVEVRDGALFLEDLTNCNFVRDFGQVTVYVNAPEFLEIHSKTEQLIRSEGVISVPIFRLLSLEQGDEAGTGDFEIQVNVSQLVVETNNASAFNIKGNCSELLMNVYAGNGKFRGKQLQAQTIKLFHRGSNDLEIAPVQSLEGT